MITPTTILRIGALVGAATLYSCTTEERGRPEPDEHVVWLETPASEDAKEIGGVVTWHYGVAAQDPPSPNGLTFAIGEGEQGEEVVSMYFEPGVEDETPTVRGYIAAPNGGRAIEISLPLSIAANERTVVDAAVQDWRELSAPPEVAGSSSSPCTFVVKSACSAAVAGTLILTAASCGAICGSSTIATLGISLPACAYGCSALVGTTTAVACGELAEELCEPIDDAKSAKDRACEHYDSWSKDLCTTEEWVCCSEAGGCNSCAPYGGYCPANTYNCGYGGRPVNDNSSGGDDGGDDGWGSGDDENCADCSCQGEFTDWEGTVCGDSTEELVDQCWNSCY